MENLNMGLLSSSSPKLVLGYPSSFRVPFTFRNSRIAPRCSPRFSVSALSHSHGKVCGLVVIRKSGGDRFASVSSSSNQQTSSVGATPNLVPPPPSSSQIGSPLFWIAVGVGFSALFSWVSRRVSQQVSSSVKNYAMEQALKTVMSQMNAQNNQFSNAAFSPPFPYATPQTSKPATSPSPAASQPAVTVDVPATKVEAAPATDVKDETEPKKYAFVDVSPEETIQKSPFESFEDVTEDSSSKDVQFPKEVSQNGAASNQGYGAFEGSQSTRKAGSVLSVEDLEKMLEDPTLQQIVYPYLPEEIRNPETFKWMMQNPQYRRQLEDMLNNMSGRDELNSHMVESLKNFDLNSPEVKQQFDQIGLTPQEVMTKIMASPEIASAFQSPRVQAAIMDCSTNPQNLYKYKDDKEVMDMIKKLEELFPGVTGLP